MPRSLTLRAVLRTLRMRYGRPPAPVSADPFQLVLWEQVAYLVPDERRARATAGCGSSAPAMCETFG